MTQERPKSTVPYGKEGKEAQKVLGWIAEAACAVAQAGLDPELVPDLEDVTPHVWEVLNQVQERVMALLREAEENRLEGEGIHPENFFPDALARTIRRRINAV